MLEVLHGGLQTTVQDLGRSGFRHLGVGTAGAVDSYSMRLANLLVGNAPDTALLEITLSGPRLRLARSARIAIAGARIAAHCGDRALPTLRPIDLPAGTELHVGRCAAGARAYFAIDGGIEVAPLMRSASTDLRAGFGGHEGRALRSGDRIALGAARCPPVATTQIAPWWIDARPDIDVDDAARLHVLSGPDATAPSTSLFGAGWRVSSRSDRQGLRLDGPPLRAHDAGERLSSAVVPGAIQLPPDGQPIVLLADAQTTGGYPCVGYVASADLPRLGQCRPGDELQFAPIDAAAALLRLRAQDARLQRIAIAIAQRLAVRA